MHYILKRLFSALVSMAAGRCVWDEWLKIKYNKVFVDIKLGPQTFRGITLSGFSSMVYLEGRIHC